MCTLWEIVPTLFEFENNHRVGAAQLYELITNSFTSRNINLQNVSAFGSDGYNVMMGANNSVAQRFRENDPNIIIVKCPSHSIHLIIENTVKELPGDIVKTCSTIHSFFSRSPQRQLTLIEFQVHLDTDIQKISRPSSTRWLSLEACILRLINQWDPVRLYFIDAFHLENIDAAGPILDFFNSSTQKCYILFLGYILPKINVVNKFF